MVSLEHPAYAQVMTIYWTNVPSDGRSIGWVVQIRGQNKVAMTLGCEGWRDLVGVDHMSHWMAELDMAVRNSQHGGSSLGLYWASVDDIECNWLIGKMRTKSIFVPRLWGQFD